MALSGIASTRSGLAHTTVPDRALTSAISPVREFLHHLLDSLRRDARPAEIDGDLAKLARERKRHLVVLVVHRRAGIEANVERLVSCPEQRLGPGLSVFAPSPDLQISIGKLPTNGILTG